MSNPFAMKSWSPYVVGAGIGIISWFAFASATKHLAITLQFEHAAAMAHQAIVPGAEQANPYYSARASEGKAPRVSWEMTLLAGVFLGALLSSWLSGDRARISVPPLWRWRFGDNAGVRFIFAFLGGGLMVLGARLAGGCTSGHGISGTLQLALSSWVFIPLAFIVAAATAFAMFGKEGRHHV